MKVLIVSSGNSALQRISVYIKEQGEYIRKNDIDVEYFLILGRGLKGYFHNFLKLYKHVKSNKYDIIHAHYGLVGFLCVLQRRVPVVITFHGSDINNKNIRFISYLAMLGSKANIFVSKKMLHRTKSNKDYIIPCGIDIPNFHFVEKNVAKKQLALKLDKFYILFSRNFDSKVKNYSLAKEAITRIESVVLVELRGYTREEVNLLLHACDLVLMTSYAEGSPQIIKEAMACNCPIISTDVGDVKDIIGETKECYITTFEPEDVAKKIEMVLKNGERTNGKEKIKRYDGDVIALEIINIYKNILNKRTNADSSKEWQ